jgi:flagella basal body P-ring formation protein FlgA
MTHRLLRVLLPLALAGSALAATLRGASEGVTADVAVRTAIAERLARPDAEITLTRVDLPAAAPTLFRGATPEPGSRLGKPMRFIMRPTTGRPVLAVVFATVVADRPVIARNLERGTRMVPGDFTLVRGPITAVTLRRLPLPSELDGARTRRALDAGEPVGPNDVILRRAVEPGDRVTVVAVSGTIEVSAMLVASDGGDPGDIVRVVNPDAKRTLRTRVIERGRVEVEYGR